MTPTDEQIAAIEAAKTSKDNLMLSALAGCAKTSTIEMIGRALPGTPILYLVFNRRNAVEAEKRLPGHVSVRTFNGIGHRVWAAALGRKRVVVDADKMYKGLKALAPKKNGDEYFETFKETLDAARAAKIAGYVPIGTPAGHSLISPNEFFSSLDEPLEEPQRGRVDEVLRRSIREAYDGLIDFDDQIYMPTLFGGIWPSFPLVMVDEAQDLSPINHVMLRKLVKKRLIAVGDPNQSIYGFRGAVASGMAVLKEDYSMRELPLSTSFRCPQNVIRRAWNRVPHMRWPHWAPEGEVNTLGDWSVDSVPEGTAIICRNNAPLFKLGLSMIRQRRSVKLIGADIGPGLVRVLKKLGAEGLPRDGVLRAIEAWREIEFKKKRKQSVNDRAECLRVFAVESQTLGEAIAYAEHLFAATGTVQLLSGHKAKGLEWDTVFHLDPWRIPNEWALAEGGEALEQEFNIRYVIETRAKRVLNLVSMEHYYEKAQPAKAVA